MLLFRRQPLGLAVLAGVLAAGSGVVWARTGASPWRMLGQMRLIAGQIEVAKPGAAGPIEWLIRLGLAPATAAKAAALVMVPFVGTLLWRSRNRSTPTLFAVAAVGAQLWSHHKPYDELVLLLLAAPLIGLAGRVGRGWRDGTASTGAVTWTLLTTAAVVVSITHVGVPRLFGGSGTTGWISLQVLAWSAGLAVLIFHDRPNAATVGTAVDR